MRPGSFSAEEQFGTVFAGTALLDWLRDRDVDTITLLGHMTDDCVLASGAIDLVDEAGPVDARTVHTTLLALLHSTWAAVADTDQWSQAVASGAALTGSDLVVSATQGAARLAG